MSEFVFKLPDLGEGMVESEIGEWFVKVGDRVEEDTVLGSMMTDKAAVELSSPVTGTVTKLAGEPGDIVAIGAALVVFETDGDVADAESLQEDAPAEPAPASGNGSGSSSRHLRQRSCPEAVSCHDVAGNTASRQGSGYRSECRARYRPGRTRYA